VLGRKGLLEGCVASAFWTSSVISASLKPEIRSDSTLIGIGSSDETPLAWSLVCPTACLTRAAHALVVCQTLLLHLFTEGFELLRIVVQTPLATSTPVAVRFRGFLTRDWKTDFSKALIPLAEIQSGGLAA
jgi:hypothetical protein